MSAECEKHGVDLHGDTISGLLCPVCEREKEIGQLRARVEELEGEIEEALRCLTLIGHVPRSENTWADRCQAAVQVLQAESK